MIEIQTYFNRPTKPYDRYELLLDIQSAAKFVGIASAWFTDMDLARAVVSSPAKFKVVVLSQADLNRPGSKEVYDFFLANETPDIGDVNDEPEGLALAVLGSGDFKEGIMHNKFVVIDDGITWTGSFNYTYQARRNYENLIRIQSSKVARTYIRELQDLLRDIVIWSDYTQFAFGASGFRCTACEKLKPYLVEDEDGGSWRRCADCVKRNRWS